MAWILNPFTGNFDYYLVGSSASVVDGVLLAENDDYFTMENDDYIATE